MEAECVAGVLVRVAAVYWAASFVVLLLRVLCVDFARLTGYGGRSGAAAAVSTDGVAGGGGSRKGAARRAAPANRPTGTSAAPIRWLASSALGSRRITRQRAFSTFYTAGLATCAALLAIRVAAATQSHASHDGAAPPLTCAPLLLFAVHCAVRLGETRLVQRFRPGDTVTVFAAVAGTTFYIMAAISSAAPPRTRVPQEAHLLRRLFSVQCLVAAGVAAHLSLQAIQITAHTILARMRLNSPSSTSAVGDAPGEEWDAGVWRRVQRHLTTSHGSRGGDGGSGRAVISAEHLATPELHGAWRRYRYPYHTNVCFRAALDPHYTCEIFMYAVNAALLVLCVLPDMTHSSATSATTTTTAMAAPELQRHSGGGAMLASAASHLQPPVPPSRWPLWWWWWCGRGDTDGGAPWRWSALASAGVAVFTAVNLSITAAEHRRFWSATNATRRLVRSALQAVVAEDQAHASEGLGSDDGGRLPDAAVRAAERLLDGPELDEEALPPWNVFPLLW
ncbi:hypothetical protein NESM_000455500 [Novymonas esmeraldas]|uniref:Polyprenol reductase n=1 Tax=Novymonas esmeraldas TaxID=1808958 RepID=A0AAW0EPX2_9TRYP